MHIDWKRNPYQLHWWDEKVIKLVMYISRNDLVLVGLGIILVFLYFKFPIDWNAALGVRYK